MKKIMFSDKFGLTQAVLEGRKTQTRRIVLERYANALQDSEKMLISSNKTKEKIGSYLSELDTIILPYKVRETVAIAQSYKDCGTEAYLWKETPGWTNKMFVKANLMPHHIKIERVRVERLQDISEEDCIREGVYEVSQGRYKSDGLNFIGHNPIAVYASLIKKISGTEIWDKNPFVFVYDFKLIK